MFYICANKHDGLIGMFLIAFESKNIHNYKFISSWHTKLEIDNVNMYILRGKDSITKNNYKELIIGYKTIFVNTYNVMS